MANYVRTKEKVYEVVEENERYYKCCYDNGSITLVAKFDNDVNGFSKALKTADSIEELCDMFFIVDNSGKSKPAIVDLGLDEDDEYEAMDLQPYKDACYIHHNIDLYGAIYTDKGLIYVAKMNNEREFELI